MAEAWNQQYTFFPPRWSGLALHLVAIFVLGGVSSWALWQATHAQVGPDFAFYLSLSVPAALLVLAMIYRGYALLRAYYQLERDGLRISWGLRTEVIPMDHILWMRPAGDLEPSLPLPWVRWPGAVLGTRKLSDGSPVEFLAADTHRLILISTLDQYVAISPEDPGAFLDTFRRFIELGSLTPLPAESVFPTFLLARVWETRPARILLLSGFVLTLVLFGWVSQAIPQRELVTLGFNPEGGLRDLVPSVRLMLLPVLSAFIYLADLAVGLFFFRRNENILLAYLLWGCGVLTPALFLISVFFILNAG